MQIRVVLFLGTLLQGIIDALAAVEVSVAVALGYPERDHSSGTSSGKLCIPFEYV